MEAIMASKKYWIKRCAELEKHMAASKWLTDSGIHNTAVGHHAEAIRQKLRTQKEFEDALAYALQAKLMDEKEC